MDYVTATCASVQTLQTGFLATGLICSSILLAGCGYGGGVSNPNAGKQFIQFFKDVWNYSYDGRPSLNYLGISDPNARFRSMGWIEQGDALPAGELFHVSLSNETTSADVIQSGKLVVNFAAPTPKGESSYLAFTSANCDTGGLFVYGRTTFKGRNASGTQIDDSALPRGLTIATPSAPLANAVQAICKQRK
jgi:hypothetical protein